MDTFHTWHVNASEVISGHGKLKFKNLGKCLLTRDVKIGVMDTFHTWKIDISYKEKNSYYFGGGQRSCHFNRGKNKNLVNKISQGRKHGYFPYLACKCVIVRK